MRWLGLAGFVSAIAMACSSFSATPAETASPGASDGGALEASAPPDDTDGDAPSMRDCGDGGFCDDFESPELVPRGWSKFSETFAGIAKLGPPGGLKGGGGFELTVDKTTDDKQSVLSIDHGPRTGDWSYRLAFDARVSTDDPGIDGPRLVTRVNGVSGTNDENRLDLYTHFGKGGVSVYTLVSACAKLPNCKMVDLVKPTAIAVGYHHYDLDVTVTAASPPGEYGTVTFTVDGVAVTKPLTIPLGDLSERLTQFGISFASAQSSGLLDLDNVRVDVTND